MYFNQAKYLSMKWKLAYILIFWLLWIKSVAIAQDTVPSPFHTGLTENWIWSPDSQEFIFSDFADAPSGLLVNQGDPSYLGEYWYDYHVQSETLTRSAAWPLQPSWLFSQYQELNVFGSNQNRSSFIFGNPNNTLFAYASNQGEITVPLNISDGKSFVTANNAPIGNPLTDTRFFQIRWNETGTALASFNISDISTYVGYATNFQSELGLVEPESVNFYRSIPNRIFTFNLPNYTPIYDVGNDTAEVLLLADEIGDSPVEFDSVPLIWHPLSPETSLIIDALKNRNIRAGIFAPNNESQIIFLDETGLILFDRVSNEIQTLTTAYKSTMVNQALFSPDGQWLVLDIGNNLHLLSVLDLLP